MFSFIAVDGNKVFYTILSFKHKDDKCACYTIIKKKIIHDIQILFVYNLGARRKDNLIDGKRSTSVLI